MSDWTQVGENLVRHKGGKIYLRAKVAGKVIRQSLETSDLRLAKIKRDLELETLRKAAVKSPTSKIRTLGDALTAASSSSDLPHLKTSTKDYYSALFAILRKMLPTEVLARSWTKKEALNWWKVAAAKYAPQRANNLLACARKVTAAMIEAGVRRDDPLEGLRRVRIQKRHHESPGVEMIESVVADIASQRKRSSVESARYVAFLAYSGCRHGEAAAMTWEDVGEDRLTIRGGAEGTKGGEIRTLPMSSRLRALIDSMRPPEASGPLFSIRSPRIALDNACRRLKISHLSLHDLRHHFATHAVERGVDVATIAKWMGHKDGGVLVLKTYGHARDEHGAKEAAKL